MAEIRTGNSGKLRADEDLRGRLEEAEETLRAIRSGEVDALIVSTDDGDQVFTLKGADRSYRALIEHMNEGALSLTLDGIILYANQRFANMLKTPLEQVIGTEIHAWITEDGQNVLDELLNEGRGGQFRGELGLAASDGSQVPVSLSVNRVPIDGVRDSLGVVATDLTDQKQAEQSLRESEAKFRNLFENSPLGKCLVGANGGVQVNKAYCEILGYSEDELRTKSWQDVTHPDDVAATADVLQDLAYGSLQSARFEKRFLNKKGNVVWGDVTIAIARDASGKPLYTLTAINDVTARKQADQAVQDVKQHLQRNIEMERLRLAQELHDAPLQELYAVIYRLEELRAQSEPAPAQVLEQVIENIQKTLSSLRATASELRPPALSRFGLEKAARSYIQDFCDKNPGIAVRHALARDGQLLPEDMRLVLFRVLQESLANVVRHAAATEVEVRFNFDAEEARIEIADNGKGFETPRTWLGMVRGGHYGLAGMDERVSAAGGTLNVESKPGIGTMIKVVLPLGRM